MFVNRYSTLSIAAALSFSVACASGGGDDADLSTSTTPPAELDVIGLSQRPASLLVLDASATAATRARLDRALAQLGGAVIATLPPRLVVAQVPDGAEAVLAAHGVVARHDRALADRELPGATLAEDRFVAVYSNRWHQPSEPIVARRQVLAPDAAFEASPSMPPPVARFAPGEPHPEFDPEDQVSVPYASGTVVVAVVLPESNGAIDASSEDWNEDAIRATYLKVQAALDTIATSEPNAALRYVLHFESRPAAGGLVGTVDSDYEFGQRAQWGDWVNESLATAHVMARILGHDVDPGNPWAAMQEYQLGLRQQYGADAAFVVLVAANERYTSGLRPHAYIGGPWTTLDSQTGWETFTHEFGHIFGALDEYCPDACVQPTALQGYLGIYNANAHYRDGDLEGGGINDGRGEAAPSLMQYNQPDMINGYTRAAWGWLDVDGDGIVDVRDTFPRSELTAAVTGQVVRLTGQIVDAPVAALWRTRYSVNRLVGLQVEIIRSNVMLDTVELDLPGDTRGRQAVDLTLPPLTAGTYQLRLRARNDVGNVELAPQTIALTITGSTNVAPIPHLELPALRALSTGASYPLTARAVDPEGGTARVRIDLGADGTFETGWATSQSLAFTPTAGVYAIAIEAKDSGGRIARQRVERLAFAGNAPPQLALTATSGLVHGTTTASVDLTAAVVDPEGGATELAWRTDLVTADGDVHVASGWGAGASWNVALTTPERLRTTKLHLGAGDWSLARGWIRDVIALDARTLAVAAGTDGIWFVDISDATAPVVTARLQLETVAHSLLRQGNRLYVLGSALAVVDISDRTRPREIPQVFATSGERESTLGDTVEINDGDAWGASHWHSLEDGERISSARVTVAIDHARHADLVITLVPPKQFGLAPVVLRDHRPAPAGQREFVFTSANTSALRALDGSFAAEGWTVQVVDDVANGKAGTLIGSQVRFATRSRAAAVLPEASHLIGTLSGGELVVGGAGIQVLDVALPFWITQMSRIRGTGTYDAVLVGDTVVWAGGQDSKTVSNPVLRGLAAVDLDFPWAPWLIRVDDADDLGATPSELAKIGNRLYVRMQPVCDEEAQERGCPRDGGVTWVGSASGFANGSHHWVQGESALRVDRGAFGNGQRVWTIGEQGHVQQLDVAQPGNLRVISDYPQSWANELLKLGNGGDVLLFQGSIEALLANLGDVTSTLSRTYRVTVEARDAAGAISRASQTVHVIPYDHAPEVTSVAQIGGAVAGDAFGFQVFGSDPDRAHWDPALVITADWNGDGVMDADPVWAPGGNPGELWHTFDAPGTYPVTFEVRDGFWARARFTQTVVVQ